MAGACLGPPGPPGSAAGRRPWSPRTAGAPGSRTSPPPHWRPPSLRRRPAGDGEDGSGQRCPRCTAHPMHWGTSALVVWRRANTNGQKAREILGMRGFIKSTLLHFFSKHFYRVHHKFSLPPLFGGIRKSIISQATCWTRSSSFDSLRPNL